MRLLLLLALASCTTAAACGGDCAPAAYYVAGTFGSSFRCADPATPMCFDDTDVLTVTQSGDAASPGSDVTFTDDAGGSFSGQLCGSTFTWTGRGDGFAESGVWTFASADRFSKSTAFDPDDGTGRGCCIGDGARRPLPDPAVPAMCPALTCSP